MSSLYELDKEYLEALNKAMSVDEETGEVFINEFVLEELEGQYEAKIDNIMCFIKNQQALSAAIKKEEEALKERRASIDKKIESLKSYVASSLNLRGLEKLETPRNKLSFRTSKSVLVKNENLIDNKYFLFVMNKKLDKKSLLDELKKGVEIEGCELLVKSNLQIK